MVGRVNECEELFWLKHYCQWSVYVTVIYLWHCCLADELEEISFISTRLVIYGFSSVFPLFCDLMMYCKLTLSMKWEHDEENIDCGGDRFYLRLR